MCSHFLAQLCAVCWYHTATSEEGLGHMNGSWEWPGCPLEVEPKALPLNYMPGPFLNFLLRQGLARMPRLTWNRSPPASVSRAGMTGLCHHASSCTHFPQALTDSQAQAHGPNECYVYSTGMTSKNPLCRDTGT